MTVGRYAAMFDEAYDYTRAQRFVARLSETTGGGFAARSAYLVGYPTPLEAGDRVIDPQHLRVVDLSKLSPAHIQTTFLDLRDDLLVISGRQPSLNLVFDFMRRLFISLGSIVTPAEATPPTPSCQKAH